MSHHLDSPQARADVRLDITDYYVFRGQTGTVFVVNVDSSIAGPDAPRGFHPESLAPRLPARHSTTTPRWSRRWPRRPTGCPAAT
jgi:hypothetical protein